jgi:hypothetical protein
VLMRMEIHLTSPRSCFILHGTQLRIPWHVLLQIACICIMRRGCPTEVFFWLTLHEDPGPSTATRDGAGLRLQFLPLGPEGAADPQKITCCYANRLRHVHSLVNV